MGSDARPPCCVTAALACVMAALGDTWRGHPPLFCCMARAEDAGGRVERDHDSGFQRPASRGLPRPLIAAADAWRLSVPPLSGQNDVEPRPYRNRPARDLGRRGTARPRWLAPRARQRPGRAARRARFDRRCDARPADAPRPRHRGGGAIRQAHRAAPRARGLDHPPPARAPPGHAAAPRAVSHVAGVAGRHHRHAGRRSRWRCAIPIPAPPTPSSPASNSAR